MILVMYNEEQDDLKLWENYAGAAWSFDDCLPWLNLWFAIEKGWEVIGEL